MASAKRKHNERFRTVSNRYPRQVADAYREAFGDVSLAMEDSDEVVAGVVAAWERGHGIEPRDWPAIGADERDEGGEDDV